MIDRILWTEWVQYLESRWGLDPRFAVYVAAAQTWIQQNGGEAVRITSGYRSPARQLELQNRWDAGNRVGLVARPADRSWHMQGLAVDVDTRSPEFAFFRSLMLYWGNRWGGQFRSSDPVHFDRPIGKAKSIRELLSS
ncbi:M15 family metallopeptidase [Candidatus Poribacteria bacterium]|nr:M15 family metallopeptidase [Candidatus Poribacteria bacterium]